MKNDTTKQPKHLRFLKAESIQPNDDGFHRSKNIVDIEWWYFDAVFDNEYSVHVGFRIYHVKGFGILQQRINIYHKGTPIVESKNVEMLGQVDISRDKPHISVKNKGIVIFDMEKFKINNQWRYHIDLSIKDSAVNLIFEGTTTGWKIETDTTCWTVPLPKAIVSGSLTIHGKTMTVSGIGYHDHNWGYSPITVIQNQGWYWGRITAETLHLTWANTFASLYEQDLIAVLNKETIRKSNNFTDVHSIHPKNINFTATDFTNFQRFQIPYTFHLTFKEIDPSKHETISADIMMNTVDVHYNRIFIIHYWRYHVNTNGTLQRGEAIERIKDKPQIIEFLSFKQPRFQ